MPKGIIEYKVRSRYKRTVHWLLKPDGLSAKIINSFTLDLFTPSSAIGELLDHTDVWLEKNPRIDVSQFVNSLSSFMDIVFPPYDPSAEQLASSLLRKIDPDDAPFLTVALMKKAEIWSYNKHFDGFSVARVRTYEIELTMSYQNSGRCFRSRYCELLND